MPDYRKGLVRTRRIVREELPWVVSLDPQTLSGALRKSNKKVFEVFTVCLLPAFGYEILTFGEFCFVCVDNWRRHHDNGLDIFSFERQNGRVLVG